MAKFEDLSIDQQVEVLKKAVVQLQNRFNDHSHKADGLVVIGTYQDEVSVEYPEA